MLKIQQFMLLLWLLTQLVKFKSVLKYRTVFHNKLKKKLIEVFSHKINPSMFEKASNHLLTKFFFFILLQNSYILLQKRLN